MKVTLVGGEKSCVWDALKASMQKPGQAKVRYAVRKQMGRAAPKEQAPPLRAQSRGRSARRDPH
jgi:hypothetical protein